ncbi:hypothetical protein CDIK_2461 [Cucumispora dikerogammari]|nr:hypothetical protein CDIK_2461 [Cucumispora dikerogammari]
MYSISYFLSAPSRIYALNSQTRSIKAVYEQPVDLDTLLTSSCILESLENGGGKLLMLQDFKVDETIYSDGLLIRLFDIKAQGIDEKISFIRDFNEYNNTVCIYSLIVTKDKTTCGISSESNAGFCNNVKLFVLSDNEQNTFALYAFLLLDHSSFFDRSGSVFYFCHDVSESSKRWSEPVGIKINFNFDDLSFKMLCEQCKFEINSEKEIFVVLDIDNKKPVVIKYSYDPNVTKTPTGIFPDQAYNHNNNEESSSQIQLNQNTSVGSRGQCRGRGRKIQF